MVRGFNEDLATDVHRGGARGRYVLGFRSIVIFGNRREEEEEDARERGNKTTKYSYIYSWTDLSTKWTALNLGLGPDIL